MSDPVKSPDPLYDPIYGDAVVLITDLKAEIAALQTERDRLRAQLEERLYETAPRLANENKGLRAALEEIANLDGLRTTGEAEGIARRELERDQEC